MRRKLNQYPTKAEREKTNSALAKHNFSMDKRANRFESVRVCSPSVIEARRLSESGTLSHITSSECVWMERRRCEICTKTRARPNNKCGNNLRTKCAWKCQNAFGACYSCSEWRPQWRVRAITLAHISPPSNENNYICVAVRAAARDPRVDSAHRKNITAQWDKRGHSLCLIVFLILLISIKDVRPVQNFQG